MSDKVVPKVPRQGKPAEVARCDGRSLRSANTRRLVAQAYLSLLEEGAPRPTARAIAERAGVSERAVFRHFQDIETLLAEAARIQIERVGATVPKPAPLGGPLETRLEAFADRWCDLHEKVTPVRRVALLYEPVSPEVARRLAWVRGLQCMEIENTFGAELSALGTDVRREGIAALAAASSWSTWNELRSHHGFDLVAARRTVALGLSALLARLQISN